MTGIEALGLDSKYVGLTINEYWRWAGAVADRRAGGAAGLCRSGMGRVWKVRKPDEPVVSNNGGGGSCGGALWPIMAAAGPAV